MWKQVKTIPTILALLLLTTGAISGTILIRRNQTVFLRANPSTTPQQITITNLQDTSFTVSWITTNPTSGTVNYSETDNLTLTAKDSRDQRPGEQKYPTHYIPITGLTPQTTYYFIVNSNGKPFDNFGSPYQITTAPFFEHSPPPDSAFGQVVDPQNRPVEGALVLLKNPAFFTPQSTLTNRQGQWNVLLSQARSPNLTQFATYHLQTTDLTISVHGGSQGTAIALVKTANDSPTPDIQLGQASTYDWRSLPSSTESAQPSLQSQFQFAPPATALESTPGENLLLFNPQPGEILYTLKPLFLGQAPPKTTITIAVAPHINNQITTSDERGNWQWSPSNNLTPGLHTATISYTDSSGQTYTLTRSFTTLAESGLPAFTASPGATITPTVPPSLTPTIPEASPTPGPTLTPTTPATPTPSIPEAGILWPTLSLTGISFILLGAGLLLAL